MRRSNGLLTLVLGATLGMAAGSPLAGRADAQTLAQPSTDRGPRFLMASTPKPVRLDESRTPILRHRLTLDLDDVSVGDALESIAAQSGLRFVYSKDVVPSRARVRLKATEISVAAALTEILLDARVDVVFERSGQVALVKRPPAPPAPPVGIISGRVTDRTTSAPVVGAQVAVVGTSLGRVTDDEGRYTIAGVPAGARSVSARRVGYAAATQSVTVTDGSTTTLDFSLTPVPSRLEEVVTTATGDQRRREVGNAIGTISAEEVARTEPIRNLSDLLSGRVANVQILNATGLSGSGTRIRIRGLSSVSLTNDPMIILDGVRIDANPIGVALAPIARVSRLNDLNPDEIESIDVIRGPSAATLYGTDASNGVVVIKTKRGTAGAPRWTATAELGAMYVPVTFPDNYYAWGRRPTGATVQCMLPDVAAGLCTRDSLTTFNVLENDPTSPFGTGNRQQYGLQVSGGQSTIRYFLSGDLEMEGGLYKMPDDEIARITTVSGSRPTEEQIDPNTLRRVNLRANTSSSFGENLDITVSSGYVTSRNRIPTTDGQGIFALLRNGLLGPGFKNVNNGSALFPFGDIMQMLYYQDVRRFTGSGNSNWRPTSWLAVRASGGGDIVARYDDQLQRRDQGANFSNRREGVRSVSRTTVERYTLDLGATGNVELVPNLRSRTSLGTQYYHDRSQTTGASATSLAPGSRTVAGGATRDGSETTVQSITLGIYAEQTLSWRDRLFLSGAIRNDNNSAFGKDFESAIYPKASLSWVLSQEPFFPKASALSNLRLRLAWGASGVQPTPTAALIFYAPFAATYQGQNLSALRLAGLGDPKLKPERSSEVEAGFDLGLFDQRAVFELTYFNKKSEDALISRTIPPSVGAGTSSRFENLGSVRNSGVEASLQLRALDTQRATWDINISGSHTKNELLTLGPGIPPVILGVLQQRHVPGYPIFAFWDRPIRGFNDANGDGILVESEVQVGDTAVFIGPIIPENELSINSSLQLFNRLRIGAQVDYRGDFVVQNTTDLWRCQSAFNCQGVNDPNASLADQAKAVASRSARYGRTTYGYIQDGTFLRFRELSATYTVPPNIARMLRSREASVTLSGRNLALWTKYGGLDPEGSQNGNDFVSDGFMTPQLRYWLVRFNVGF